MGRALLVRLIVIIETYELIHGERPEDVVLSSAVSRLQIGYCGHNRSSLAGCRRTLIASLQLYVLTPPSDPAR
jgi:hypothetical protein